MTGGAQNARPRRNATDSSAPGAASRSVSSPPHSLLLVVVLGILAPFIAPYPPESKTCLSLLSGPTAEHWLGTDTLGRDILSRLLFAIIPSLGYAAVATVVFLAVGIPFGILAGYRGGRIDSMISRIAELAMSIPRSSSCWSCSRSSPPTRLPP